MGDRRRHVPQGAESFRVQQSPIILGEPPHSRFTSLTPDAIAAETLRILGESGKPELTLGLRPDVIAAVASQVSHMGMRFQDVAAAIIGDQLHLAGKVKKGPLTLFRGQIVVANGQTGLEVVDGSLGPLTRMVGNLNGIMAEQMAASLGNGFSVDQIRIATPSSAPGITEPVLTARVARGQLRRRAA